VDETEARTIVRRCKSFTIINQEMYKSNISGVFQLPVTNRVPPQIVSSHLWALLPHLADAALLNAAPSHHVCDLRLSLIDSSSSTHAVPPRGNIVAVDSEADLLGANQAWLFPS
jgi:hypothetical protein